MTAINKLGTTTKDKFPYPYFSFFELIPTESAYMIHLREASIKLMRSFFYISLKMASLTEGLHPSVYKIIFKYAKLKKVFFFGINSYLVKTNKLHK